MNTDFDSRKERLQWLCVAIICGTIVWFYSSKNLCQERILINPITLLKLEQENPINHLFTKLVFKEMPDQMKELF